ncbi:maleylpyruvate isomerase family mycothiol-dependent enzyme [Streptomyces jumonjinensis]|uniref:maleylpyruvate isomerase family mycothiol-dependent enzyme n=1 Tax=Streptomyces jumonjinensis TaxID=1945 RepID=UPI0037B31F91
MEAVGPRDVVRDVLPEGLGDAIRATAREIAGVLDGVDDTSVPVPGSRWAVGESAAHLAYANELMADLAVGRERGHGDGTPQSLAGANERALAAFPERAAGPLAAMIVAQADRFLAAVAESRAGAESGTAADGLRGGDHPAEDAVLADDAVRTPLGPMSRAVLGSYLLTHMLGHGYDLARALGRPHMVDRTRAGLCVPFLLTVMPLVANRAAADTLTAGYAVRLWGGDSFGVVFSDGVAVTARRPPDRPDCTLLIEPVTFLLMALGRIPTWGALARGRVLAWGRKPWLGARFPTLFTAP